MLKNLFEKDYQFTRASQAEDCETLLTDVSGKEEVEKSNASPQLVPKLGPFLLWCLSIAIAVVTGVWIGSGHLADADRFCTKHISQYCTKCHFKKLLVCADSKLAPLLEDVDISYKTVRYEGSLMQENIFRQTGSPEVDTAWESLGIECKIYESEFTKTNW